MNAEIFTAVAQYGSTPFAILIGSAVVLRAILWGIAEIVKNWKG